MVIVSDSARVKAAADDIALSGNKLVAVILPIKSLDRVMLHNSWKGIPIIIISESFGTFRNFEHHIDLMRELDVTVHLACDTPENITGIKILSSLGIKTTALIPAKNPDWDLMAELGAYALLAPGVHAPIEPFDYIARHYSPTRSINWEFLYFEDPARFATVDSKGAIDSITTKAPDGTKLDSGLCGRCRGFSICHGRFSSSAPKGECSEFFFDLIDSISRWRHKGRALQSDAGACLPRNKPDNVADKKIYNETADGKEKSTQTIWIDCKGTAKDAIALSSVLKKALDTDPSVRFALVARRDFKAFCAEHPALVEYGHPPKDARIVRIDLSRNATEPGDTSYKSIARTLGIHTNDDEKLYVPWKFEDNHAVLAMLPRKERNILIVRGNNPGTDNNFEGWEKLVRMLAKDGYGVVQAGGKNDSYIRGACSILGLLDLRQLICMPRHFSAVITTDILILYAARLCMTPAVIIPDADTPLPYYDNQIIIKKPDAGSIQRSVARLLSARDTERPA